MASAQMPPAPKIVMTSAGEGIHIMERPYEALTIGQSFKERGVVEKINHPMQVDDVTVRDLRNDIRPVLGAIVSKRFEFPIAGSDRSMQVTLDLFSSDAPRDATVQRLGRIKRDHGLLLGAGFPNQHR